MRRAIARGRILPQSLSTDPRYGRLSLKAQVLYPLLWVNTDDQGRLTGDPDAIKYAACPSIDDISKADIPELLKELETQELIKVYSTSKTKAIQMLDWWEVQRLQWAYPSGYPPPEGWEDRLRYKERPDQPIITQNWTPKDKIRNTLTKEMKEAIFQRDNYTCRYCGRGAKDGVDVEIAHIIAVRDGGTNDLNNLVTACHKCNMQEPGRPPGRLPSLPRRLRQLFPQTPFEEKIKDKEENEDEKGRGRGRGITPGQPGRPSPSPTTSTLLQILTDTHYKGWGRMPDSRGAAQLRDLAEELSLAGGATAEQIHDAFKEAATHNKYLISYVKAILFDWLGIARGPP